MPDNDNVGSVDLTSLKNDVFKYIKLRLGDGMVDVELTPDHYNMALGRAIDVYRQRSANATEESQAYLTVVANQSEYILPQEVTHVRQIFRRTVGNGAQQGGGVFFEPFEAGFMNTYILSAGQLGGLLSYELFTGYQQLTATMFGGYVNFTFDIVTKKLTLVRRPESSGELFLLWTYNLRPPVQLLSNYLTMAWIKEYAYCVAKFTLGEIRSKFSSLPGPSGGATLNGDALKNEATTEMTALLEDLKNYLDNQMPLSFLVG